MSRLTAKVAGLYLLHASLTFYGNANGYRQISFRLNGAANNLTGALDTKPHATNGCILNISTIWNLAVGDYVEVIAVQTCGVALNIVGSNGGNNYGDHYFSMAKIG
jgi:hypothetical protein